MPDKILKKEYFQTPIPPYFVKERVMNHVYGKNKSVIGRFSLQKVMFLGLVLFFVIAFLYYNNQYRQTINIPNKIAVQNKVLTGNQNSIQKDMSSSQISQNTGSIEGKKDVQSDVLVQDEQMLSYANELNNLLSDTQISLDEIQTNINEDDFNF